ncbi:hypothetical protein GCM10022234_27540 [Aeromicrobium panaciterrae]|uniref:hypothetical protein n=1 Tax=Aeromicrobium panaciterrae TaxID=363861 RepID=UPI0031DCA75B
MRRLLIPLVALLMLAACNGEDMNDKDSPNPTARTSVDGVEVWDLTGTPTATSFGIPEDKAAGVYETQKPRTVRFILPEGAELTVEATLVTFERFGEGDAAHFTFAIRTAQLEPDALVTDYRDILVQLKVSTDAADKLAAEIASAPDDQTERVDVGSDEVTLDGLAIGAQAGLAPIAGSGRIIIGGSWRR